jgi:5-methyltetrahydrofolate--homocysteine methyltransferase
MITSCSPGWVKFVEHAYPDHLAHLSSCKSPHTMLGALVKSFYAEKIGALALIRNTREDALRLFMECFAATEQESTQDTRGDTVLPVEERLQAAVMRGKRAGMDALIEEARRERDAFEIINAVLIPAMQRVGELFGAGKMQLPFVLESAETMRFAVNLLEPHIVKQENAEVTSVVLATVRGDVHDIGKNLVDIILSNNGYAVHNLGIKCEVGTIIEKIREIGANALGLSGLLVKSTVIMKEYLTALAEAGIRIPVLLGGAALTREWAEHCQTVYGGRVVYCADAFDGLRALGLMKENALGAALAEDRARYGKQAQEAQNETPGGDGSGGEGQELPYVIDISAHVGRISETRRAEDPVFTLKAKRNPEEAQRGLATNVDQTPHYYVELNRSDPPVYPKLVHFSIPAIPFNGSKLIDRIPLAELIPRMNARRLYRARWEMRRSDMDSAAYADFLEREARPHSERLALLFAEKGLCAPRAVCGFFPCRRVPTNILEVYGADHVARARFHFPRHEDRSLIDYFTNTLDFDLLPLQAVTLGGEISAYTQELYARGEYREYFLAHGFAVELTETLAGYVHDLIRHELGFADIAAPAPGAARSLRFSFGYPACPDLAHNHDILRLLEAGRIGITESEIGEMVPEFSTSAFIIHHPEARY